MDTGCEEWHVCRVSEDVCGVQVGGKNLGAQTGYLDTWSGCLWVQTWVGGKWVAIYIQNVYLYYTNKARDQESVQGIQVGGEKSGKLCIWGKDI